VQEKDPPPALPIPTLVALGAIGLLTRLNHFRALAVGALDRYRDHQLPSRATFVYAEHTGKLPICNITGLEFLTKTLGRIGSLLNE
jgi:hypothetical protein